MNDELMAPQETPASLQRALDVWEKRGDSSPLERWLSRELDASGAPVEIPLEVWPVAIERIAQARGVRPGWPEAVDERAADLVRMLMRFSRPDGRQAIVPAETAPRAYWKRVSTAIARPDIDRVLSWWLPGRDAEPVPPPLPAWSSTDRVLGVLRADWTPRGDFLVFDQRQADAGTRFELFGAGVPWFGPIWSAPSPESTPKPTAWGTNSAADVAEWTFRSGGRQVTRLVLLLRGRRMAILADQVEGLAPDEVWETHVDVPAPLSVESIPDLGSLSLRKRPGAKVTQLAALSGARLEFDPATRRISLAQRSRGGRALMVMLISWDAQRARKALAWKPLTVAERGAACSPDVAWASRVSWGRGDSFVIYRSLGAAARRSFLGFTTTARFAVGRFAIPEGDIEPIVTLA
ncbi:hypothetical protein [Paludisphaera rhizosphaerae]|uniref:hypothetical protein n=1 Tax=Paludisphaera rhizosphaerae TaxID=2711216 RepID=UPI0013EE179D|nr:hypothetical protein [Paludisphaera rhizosphaerae]